MYITDLGTTGATRFSSARSISKAAPELLFERIVYLLSAVSFFQAHWPWLSAPRCNVMQDPLEDGLAAEFMRDMHEGRLCIAALPRDMHSYFLGGLSSALATPVPSPHHENPFYSDEAREARREFPRARRQIWRLREGKACGRCDGSGRYRGHYDCNACEGSGLNAPGRRAWAEKLAARNAAAN